MLRLRLTGWRRNGSSMAPGWTWRHSHHTSFLVPTEGTMLRTRLQTPRSGGLVAACPGRQQPSAGLLRRRLGLVCGWCQWLLYLLWWQHCYCCDHCGCDCGGGGWQWLHWRGVFGRRVSVQTGRTGQDVTRHERGSHGGLATASCPDSSMPQHCPDPWTLT